jgi:hypothetical protein
MKAASCGLSTLDVESGKSGELAGVAGVCHVYCAVSTERAIAWPNKNSTHPSAPVSVHNRPACDSIMPFKLAVGIGSATTSLNSIRVK